MQNVQLIPTGSRALDSALGGGIRGGLLTDVYGEAGAGKTQLCFTLAANCAASGGRVIYVDTVGTFRPQRILEIAGSNSVLENITYLRALVTSDQRGVVRRISETSPQLVIIDTVTDLFSVEYSGPSRHLALMKHLRELAVSAILSGFAIVVTNMVRNIPATVIDQAGRNLTQAIVPSQQREYLGSSMSIFSHVRIKLEIANAEKSRYRAKLVQPPRGPAVEFAISSKGLLDLQEDG